MDDVSSKPHHSTVFSASRRRLIVGGAAMAIAGTAAARSAAAQAPKTMRVGVHKGVVFVPSLLLQPILGAAWNVELSYFGSPADMANAIVSRSIDVGYTGVTIASIARSKGQPIIIVASSAGKGTAIIVGTKTSIQKVEDLKGKTIGQVVGGIQDVQLREQLRMVGLSMKDVNPIAISFADLPAALQNGSIDAFCGGEPASTKTIEDGYGRLLKYPYDTPVGTINAGILARETTVQDNPDMLRAFVGAHRDAVIRLRGNLDEAAELAFKNWGFPLATSRKALDNVDFRWALDDAFMSDLGNYMARKGSWYHFSGARHQQAGGPRLRQGLAGCIAFPKESRCSGSGEAGIDESRPPCGLRQSGLSASGHRHHMGVGYRDRLGPSLCSAVAAHGSGDAGGFLFRRLGAVLLRQIHGAFSAEPLSGSRWIRMRGGSRYPPWHCAWIQSQDRRIH
jgi:NitT/TauT family transport system substrate-binding protein